MNKHDVFVIKLQKIENLVSNCVHWWTHTLDAVAFSLEGTLSDADCGASTNYPVGDACSMLDITKQRYTLPGSQPKWTHPNSYSSSVESFHKEQSTIICSYDFILVCSFWVYALHTAQWVACSCVVLLRAMNENGNKIKAIVVENSVSTVPTEFRFIAS